MEPSSFKIFADAGYLGPDKLLPLIRRYRLVDLSDTARELLLENEKIRTSLDKARMYTILAPVAAMFISAVFICSMTESAESPTKTRRVAKSVVLCVGVGFGATGC